MCCYSIIGDEAVRMKQVQGFGKPLQQIRLFQRMGMGKSTHSWILRPGSIYWTYIEQTFLIGLSLAWGGVLNL